MKTSSTRILAPAALAAAALVAPLPAVAATPFLNRLFMSTPRLVPDPRIISCPSQRWERLAKSTFPVVGTSIQLQACESQLLDLMGLSDLHRHWGNNNPAPGQGQRTLYRDWNQCHHCA
ncbi:hypothetical protein AVO46_17910 [Vibrio cholerae]|nr:hypothetical protein AVO46_17910 [Vibrio cholerae]